MLKPIIPTYLEKNSVRKINDETSEMSVLVLNDSSYNY